MSELTTISAEPLALKDHTLELKTVGDTRTAERYQFYHANLVDPPNNELMIKEDTRGLWDMGKLNTQFGRFAWMFWFFAVNQVAMENILLAMPMGKGDPDIGFRHTERHSTTYREFADWMDSYTAKPDFGLQTGSRSNCPRDYWIVSVNDRMPRTSLGVAGIYTSVEWAIWKFIKTGCIGKIWEYEGEFRCTEEGDALVLADFLDTLGLLKEPNNRYDRQMGSLRVSPAWANGIKQTHYAPSLPVSQQK